MPCPTVSHTPECLARPLTALAHPSWPRVPTWRHTSFQRPFLKATWINFCQVCLLSPFSVLHSVSTVLIGPHATPQGISTCPHFQALQTALLCGIYFLHLWAEHTQINRSIYCDCRQHTSAGHGAREGSLDQFYLDIKTFLCCFWEGRDSFQQEKSIPLSTDELFCPFSNCDLELGGSRAGYCDLVRPFPFPFSYTSIYSQSTQLDKPKN